MKHDSDPAKMAEYARSGFWKGGFHVDPVKIAEKEV